MEQKTPEEQKSTEELLKKTGKGAKNILNEFKEFISKGNVLDMAVGLIVGSAFTAIVNSLVDDMLMSQVHEYFPAQEGGEAGRTAEAQQGRAAAHRDS